MGARVSAQVGEGGLTMRSTNGPSGFSLRLRSLRSQSSEVPGLSRKPGDEVNWDYEKHYHLAAPDEYQHYMPPNMPVCPIFQQSYHVECNRSWKLICKGASNKMREFKKDGIVLFYDEFFHRLFQRDPSFTEVFPGIRKRIETLIKAMKFMLSDNGANEEAIIQRCRNLGYRHRTIPLIRPHHFATYTSTMIEVMMYWLDSEASPDVGEAWSNLVGFHLKYMLQPYLYDNIDLEEWAQNTTIPVAPRKTPATTKEKHHKKKAAPTKTRFPTSSFFSQHTERENK